MEDVGLRWYKCDFHLHTMNSQCYKKKSTDTPEMWVDEVKNNGLNCIAITDHNDYRGIDKIKDLCELEGILAFPGVELSCDSSKVHMLVLFDVNCNGDRVQEFLNQVGVFRNSLGDSGQTCNGDIFEVCKKAQEMGGIVIAAHVDEFNGVCEISHDNIVKIMDRKYINAVQTVNNGIWEDYENNKDWKRVCELLAEKYGKDISEEKAKSWYKAYIVARKSELPMLAFSDNPCAEKEAKHGTWGIGNEYTWLKMDQKPNLESVRQALLSYDMRVKNGMECKSIPDIAPGLWIKHIEISDTILNDEKSINVQFNPQLNTIIGGRGSGKSSIIRIIAGGLKAFEAEDLELINSEQKNFYKRCSKDKKGVFTKDSIVKIYLERAEDLFRLEISDIHDMNRQQRTLYKFENNDWVEISDINYMDFFKVQVYTQKQIYELALNSNSLLSIIDSDIKDLNQKIDEKEAKLSKLISKWLEIKDLKKLIDEEAKINTELKDIEERIGKYNESGISDALKEKQKYESQEKIIDNYIGRKKEQIKQISEQIDSLDSFKDDFTEIENDEMKLILKNDLSKFANSKKTIREAIDLIDNETKKLEQDIKNSAWNKEKETVEEKYTSVCVSLRQQGINFDKLDELLDNKKEKLKEIDKINSNKSKLTVIEQEQQELYNEYEKIIFEISEMRSNFIKEVIGKDANVKFNVKRGRNRLSFIQMMKSVLNKDNATTNEDINKLADIFFEKKGIEKFRALMWDIREKRDETSYSKLMRTTIIDMQQESFARMISFVAEDNLEVSYKPEKAKKYIPLSNASAGQKTTAILTFLLAYGELPLLLDQPEDDLDNKLVYDLIVTRLKKAKSKRQIIVVTHNANIPVNGDAEYIASMDSDTDKISTKYVGTMDDENIRKEICDVMEGTQDAFEMRAKKYHFKIVE
ncbi:TrlF family AAA-like ATPase [[Clostridium] hylemonae]|uniref:TrlF family AAA-like ATPase n=1 Tax=[Clostridium] hylemonae TaxID=89153 RepID=UPI001FCAA73E|nr:PHP domain-containing protein [[Clostridium] hylemonae]BDF03346.1 hypothetical protein CE91St63_04080 [[Clostridium] hylemonae]